MDIFLFYLWFVVSLVLIYVFYVVVKFFFFLLRYIFGLFFVRYIRLWFFKEVYMGIYLEMSI